MPSIAHLVHGGVEAVGWIALIVTTYLGIHARAYARLEEMKQPGDYR